MSQRGNFQNIILGVGLILSALSWWTAAAWGQNSGNAESQRHATIVSNIHNAPGWRPSHAYTPASSPATRVVNGPGWNPQTEAYIPRQPLAAYQLASGACTSAASGGPRGTGDEIVDGSCKWKYLSGVDYVSLTGWAFDNKPWQPQAYNYGDNVVSDSPLRSYRLVDAGGCASKIAPTGTGGGMGARIITNDGCQWQYWADVIYTSGVSHIPTQTYTNNVSGSGMPRLAANYQANLWNDREYVAGSNGESAPLVLQAHFDATPDSVGYSPEGGGISGETMMRQPTFYRLIVTAAPGESFRDTLKSTTPLAGYDPTKGVALRDAMKNSYNAGIEIRDCFVDLIGLQIKSEYGPGVGGGETHGATGVSIQSSIIDGGAGDNNGAVMLDAWGVVANSLIIAHGRLGITEDYPGIVVHSTLVDLTHEPNSVGVTSGGPWIFDGPVISNSAIFGFAHAIAGGLEKPIWKGRDNVTDAPVGDAGSGPWIDGRIATTVATAPGTTYGAPVARAFAAFPGDYRPGASSLLLAKGAAYGSFKSGCDARHPDCSVGVTYNFDASDIIGTTRPQNGRSDVGAWQSTRGQGAN